MNMGSYFTSLSAIVGKKKKEEEENHRTTDCVYVSFLTSFLCYQALESAEPAWHVEVEILQGSGYH